MGFNLGNAFKAATVDMVTGKTQLGWMGEDTKYGLGDYLPGIGDSLAAAKQNAANKNAAQTQMDFQERMSNSAYQRAMDDMKKAGLNPMLAFSQGGASAPQGAAPTINSETKSGLGAAALSAVMGAKGLQIQQQAANTAQSAADAQINLTKSTAAKQVAETQNIQLDTQIKKKDLPGAQIKGDFMSTVKGLIDSMKSSAKENKPVMPSTNDWKKMHPPIKKPLH